MAMPDGVEALLALAAAPRASLTQTAYNLGAFAPTAEEIRAEVLQAFPRAEITYHVDEKRQGIVDSWPADVDDSAARRDWGFAPRYDFERAFRGYLIPTTSCRHFIRSTGHLQESPTPRRSSMALEGPTAPPSKRPRTPRRQSSIYST